MGNDARRSQAQQQTLTKPNAASLLETEQQTWMNLCVCVTNSDEIQPPTEMLYYRTQPYVKLLLLLICLLVAYSISIICSADDGYTHPPLHMCNWSDGSSSSFPPAKTFFCFLPVPSFLPRRLTKLYTSSTHMGISHIDTPPNREGVNMGGGGR